MLLLMLLVSNVFISFPYYYFHKQEQSLFYQGMSRNVLDNKLLLYQLFLVVRPYYHLQFPVLHDTQYQNHLLKKGEVPFYDEVIVEEMFLHGSLLFQEIVQS